MNVVILKLNNLGDSVVFVPAVQALRRSCPDWQITLVTTPNESGLFGGPLGPQETWACPKSVFERSYRRPWVLAQWIWAVRRKGAEACLVSFDQGNAAHAVAKFSGARVRIGGNLDHVRLGRTLTEEVPPPEDGRPVTWNWRMARALARSFGRDAGWPAEPPPPDLGHLLPRGPRKRGSRRRVVVHPGAGGLLNQWGTRHFASVAQSLSAGNEVIWITRGAEGPAPEGTVGAPVGSLVELAEWLASADLFLGNNSGPMHLANALGCAGVAVTGPSALGWDPYWHRERWTVLRHPDLYCAPCERVDRKLKTCANIPSPMACLEYWTAEKVLGACRALLERPGGGQS